MALGTSGRLTMPDITGQISSEHIDLEQTCPQLKLDSFDDQILHSSTYKYAKDHWHLGKKVVVVGASGTTFLASLLYFPVAHDIRPDPVEHGIDKSNTLLPSGYRRVMSLVDVTNPDLCHVNQRGDPQGCTAYYVTSVPLICPPSLMTP